MKRFIIIACGVFIGGLALFIAINLPGWIRESRISSRREASGNIMRKLTPEIAIKNCGAPDLDVMNKDRDTRYLYYKKDDIILQFDVFSDKSQSYLMMWFGTLSFLNKDPFPDGKPVGQDDGGYNERLTQQLAYFPCLRGAATPTP
jgi:hypothetical protein